MSSAGFSRIGAGLMILVTLASVTPSNAAGGGAGVHGPESMLPPLPGTSLPCPPQCPGVWRCPHSFPHSHTYGSGGSVGGRSDTVTGGDDFGTGIVTVTETNTIDCDGDGIPGDFDGDYDTGVGGGFFGHGPWRNEATCNYGLTDHGSFVVVADVGSANIYFTIGADDTSGPAVDADGNCSTDGSITPGDPTTDPTADADDCLTVTYLNSGTNTCGGGGDGGFWVFLNGVFVDESGGNLTVGAVPTAGTITA